MSFTNHLYHPSISRISNRQHTWRCNAYTLLNDRRIAKGVDRRAHGLSCCAITVRTANLSSVLETIVRVAIATGWSRMRPIEGAEWNVSFSRQRQSVTCRSFARMPWRSPRVINRGRPSVLFHVDTPAFTKSYRKTRSWRRRRDGVPFRHRRRGVDTVSFSLGRSLRSILHALDSRHLSENSRASLHREFDIFFLSPWNSAILFPCRSSLESHLLTGRYRAWDGVGGVRGIP